MDVLRGLLGSCLGRVLLIVGGSLFLLLGLYVFTYTQSSVQDTVKTSGVVVAVKRKSDTFYPIVEFVTAKGEKVRFEHSVGSNPPRYEAGDIVDVLYKPHSPENATIDSWDIWVPSAVPIFMGALMILVSLKDVFGLLGKLVFLLRQ